jgi:mono/diheme cytochrome c family protein
MPRSKWAIILAVVISLTACDYPDTAGVVEPVGVEPAFAAQGASNPALIAEGRAIFRFETFGDETFWTDTLRMHEVIRRSVSPNTALAVGLKVDVDALPPAVIDGILSGTVRLDDPAPTVALLGLRHVKMETYTGDDVVSYWNAYVAITQMHAHGHFVDARIGVDVNNPPDLVSSKLEPLGAYQLSLENPAPVEGEFDAGAALRGEEVFNGLAQCASCHLGGALADVGAKQAACGGRRRQDPAYALRSVTKLYRSTPLRGLWHPPQLVGPYFHDGSAPTLEAVVDHYVQLFGLNLTGQHKADLVEYLKTL